jgi:hypothetical protein
LPLRAPHFHRCSDIRQRQFELCDDGLEFGHAWLLGFLELLGLGFQFADLRFDGFKGQFAMHASRSPGF